MLTVEPLPQKRKRESIINLIDDDSDEQQKYRKTKKQKTNLIESYSNGLWASNPKSLSKKTQIVNIDDSSSEGGGGYFNISEEYSDSVETTQQNEKKIIINLFAWLWRQYYGNTGSERVVKDS